MTIDSREVINRDMVFISHASEDARFTMWLALQLAKNGYGVWCDLTKLLGGENWPKEINEALQERTQKFLYILSRTSNTKLDPLNEFEVARGVGKRTQIKNFIVPLKVDDLQFDETDFRFQSYQAIVVGQSWAQGLRQVLKMLDEEKVPKNSSFHPYAVREWWRCNMTGTETLINSPESFQSNRFAILEYPENIYAHHIGPNILIQGDFAFPFFLYKDYLISFSASNDLDSVLLSQIKITHSHEIKVADLLQGKGSKFATVQQGEYILSRIINQTFVKGIAGLGYRSFSLSRSRCIFFDSNKLPQRKIVHTNNGELNSRITLWGRHYLDTWHFALVGNFVRLPGPHYCIRMAVLLKSKGMLRAAPKSVYKRWYNKTWRARLRAAMLHLADGKDEMRLPVGTDSVVRVKSLSDEFVSPISYKEPKEMEAEIDQL